MTFSAIGDHPFSDDCRPDELLYQRLKQMPAGHSGLETVGQKKRGWRKGHQPLFMEALLSQR